MGLSNRLYWNTRAGLSWGQLARWPNDYPNQRWQSIGNHDTNIRILPTKGRVRVHSETGCDGDYRRYRYCSSEQSSRFHGHGRASNRYSDCHSHGNQNSHCNRYTHADGIASRHLYAYSHGDS